MKEKDTAVDVVALVPPTSMEALPVPVWAVKRWLKDEGRSDLPDLEGALDPQFNQPKGRGKQCLRWYGPDDDETEVIFPDEDEIGPGIPLSSLQNMVGPTSMVGSPMRRTR